MFSILKKKHPKRDIANNKPYFAFILERKFFPCKPTKKHFIKIRKNFLFIVVFHKLCSDSRRAACGGTALRARSRRALA